MKAAHENLLDEFFGGEAREIERERKDNRGLNPHGAEPFHALHIGGKTPGGRFGAKDFARGGVEGERGGDVVCLRGALHGGAENGLMAEVDAIEVADGENAATL